MDDESKKKASSLSDITRTVILLGTTLVVVTLYVHTTFATNHRVDIIEKNFNKENRTSNQAIADQRKLGCLMAIKLKVSNDDLPIFCLGMK